MSTLDKSFIKAFSRTPASQQPAQPETEQLADEPHSADPPARIPPEMYTEGAMYRVDPPHPMGSHVVREQEGHGDCSNAAPETNLGASAMPPQYAAPQYVQETSSEEPLAIYPLFHGDDEAAESSQDFAPVQPQSPTLSEEEEKDIEPSPREFTGNSAREMQVAQVVSDVLESSEDADNEPFIADWEVDRFAWPEICERLLRVEGRYFRQVGERLSATTESKQHVLMIAGSRRREGRTTLALCLARCALEAGAKVALVDADFGNPELGLQLGIETPCSWLQGVMGKAPLNQVAVTSIEDGLTLFPLFPKNPIGINPGDPLLANLLEEVSAHYRLVIADVGPISSENQHPFAGSKGCPIDAAIIVRDVRYTTEEKAVDTARQLQESGISAVGIAENFYLRDAA